MSLIKFNSDPNLLWESDREMMKEEEKFVTNLMYQVITNFIAAVLSHKRMWGFCLKSTTQMSINRWTILTRLELVHSIKKSMLTCTDRHRF